MGVRVAADLRRRLASAFLHASWGRQQSERVGRLQELMTAYATSGAQLVGGFTGVLTSAFGLVAMLALAIAVSPVGALVVIAAVAVLGLALRPVRARLRTRSVETSDTGMAFATGLGEMANLFAKVGSTYNRTEKSGAAGAPTGKEDGFGLSYGVGIGFNPPKYLKAGDVVAVTIEPIGTLTNPVS
jgi:ABC-type multidrug transport system fused ATPase/permease subunit